MKLPADQESHQFNRPSPAILFECHVHPDLHDAEVFVLVMTVFGAEAIPVCLAAAAKLRTDCEGQHGVRYVSELTPTDYQGTISGVFSSR